MEKDLTKLSVQDVQLLKENPSNDVREKTIRKLTGLYKTQSLSSTEQQIIEDIFRLILTSTNIKLRFILVENLKNCKFLPPDIVQKIVNDSAQISCPFILETPVLTEKSMLTIIRQKEESTQDAIASRAEIPFRVCESIVEECGVEPILTLIRNEKADISDYAYQRLMERFRDNVSIQKSLLMRKKIPIYVLEKLIGMVPDDL